MARQTKTLTKMQIVKAISEDTGFAKADIRRFFHSLSDLAASQLSKKTIAAMTIPELGVKLAVKIRPAQAARIGRNPNTGEEIEIKAKPASKVIKALVLKSLKDRVLNAD